MPRVSPPRLLIVLATLLVLALPAAAQEVIWRGRSGGFDITWSTSDVSARRVSDGALVFSLRRRHDREWRSMSADEDTSMIPREMSVSYRVLSVVGSVISVEEHWSCDCRGAHPISSAGFHAYDLARSTPDSAHPARITDLLREAPLVRALTADRILRAAMDSAEVRTPPRTLRLLVDTLKYQRVEVPVAVDEGEFGDCSFSVGEGFPSEFALHHVANGQVAVRFSLSHDVEVCRGQMIEVGVLVPVPPRLQAALAAADARREGFLMKDARRIAADRWTGLEYAPE